MTAESVCPECGAPTPATLSCWERLGMILAWEAQDPELAAEHFLSVASFNLQHPAQFRPEVLGGLRDVFIAHLDDGISVKEIRRRVSAMAEGPTRVLVREAERKPVRRDWTMTIADVAIPDRAAGAAERVRRWAASIRVEVAR